MTMKLALPSGLLLICLSGLMVLVVKLLWQKRKTVFAGGKSLKGRWHGAIPRYRRSLHRMTGELQRASRYRSLLAIAVLSAAHEPWRNGRREAASIGAESAPYSLLPEVSSLLRSKLRACDILTYDVTQDRYIILLPETPAARAQLAMARLHALVAGRIQIDLHYAIAEFPADGLTIEDLVQHAHAKNHQAENHTR